jgi:hypothetical protein
MMPREKSQQYWVDKDGNILRPFNERENQIDDDYEWCLHDPEVRRQYGGQVVAVYKRQIWGWGKNHELAWRMTRWQPDCPDDDDLVFVAVPTLDTIIHPEEG